MASRARGVRTIAHELSTSLALAVLVVVGIAGGAYHLRARSLAEARLHQDARRWTTQLSEVSLLHLWNVDRAGLENACRAALQPPEVHGARVLDAEGRVLAEVSRSESPDFLVLREEVIHTHGGARHRLGAVELRVGEEVLAGRASERLWATVLMGLLTVGAVILASRLLVRRLLSEPLAQLGEGTAQIAAGDYDLQLPQARQADIDALVQSVNAMAQAIASREEELRSTEEQMRFALSAAQGGVWDWNVDQGTVYFSERWKTMLGYEPEEIADSFEAWEELTHPEDRDHVELAVEAHLRGESEYYTIEHRLRTKEGSYRWIAARGRLISRTSTGAPLRFVGTHTDITTLKEAAEQATLAKEAAEQATRAKDEFLANMSHEIRTPLNGIIGMTSVLSGTELSASQREFVETIGHSGDALLTIVNDILDFARVEAGTLSVLEAPFDPRLVATEAEDIVANAAQRKGLELRLEVATDLPPALLGDAARIRQVLTNLLVNAIKFTDRGEVCLSVSWREDQARLRYEVHDTGIGIAAESLGRLFNRFSQVDSSSTRTRGGTGLGLAISRHIAELMEGEIGAESELGRGSTFWLELPLEPCAPGDPAVCAACEVACVEAGSPGPIKASGGRARVLLAEDNRVNALVAEALLERLEVEVVTVGDGLQALQALEEGSFDLVLMDVQMLSSTGWRRRPRFESARPQAGRAIGFRSWP